MKPSNFLFFLSALFSTCAFAEIYKCTWPDGHVTYSNVPATYCTKVNLDPVNTTQKKASAKSLQAEKARSEELAKLQLESQQAKEESVFECKGERSCKKAFALTQVFITDHSDMKLQIATDTVLETYNPTQPEKVAIKATKKPGKGDAERINLVVSCKDVGISASASCLKKSITIYKEFAPYIEASLR
jgi:hypothetical protein